MTVSSTARLRRVLPVLACMTLLLLVSCCSPFSKGLGTDSDDFLDDQEDVEGSAAEAPLPPSATIWDTIESADADAVAELVEAVHEKDDDDARVKLAALHLFGSSTTTKLARDVEEALALAQYAADKGHPAAQFLVGFMHATGMGVDADQGKALLYYTFAALHDDPFAQMALGYRYSQGLSVKKNCEVALSHYRAVAAIVEQDVSLHGGHVVVRKRIPLVGKDDSQVSETDVIQYYQYNADRGDRASQLMMGRLFLTGHGVAQDFPRAANYLRMAANAGDGNALAYLGEMYAHGLGVEGNNDTALEYFQKAAKKTSAVGQNHLATMYLHGEKVPKDEKKAFQLYVQAAQQGLADAQYNLATLHYNGIGTAVDLKLALKYFKLAAQQGSVLAINSLASMHAAGIGLTRDCEIATGLYKNVGERAKWMTSFQVAYTAYEDERYDDALLLYLLLAELGVEVAQHNAAQVLEKGLAPIFDGPSNDTYRRALHNWRRSASQGQVVARVKVGDYHYYGHGVESNAELAASQYRLAADANNAQAIFNLGIMHHTGDGLNRDLHLAKRYYDMARAASADAELPVTLALLWLYGCFAVEYMHTRAIPAAVAAVQEWDAGDMDALLQENRTVLLVALTVLLVVVYLARTRRIHEHRVRAQEQAQREAQQQDEEEEEDEEEAGEGDGDDGRGGDAGGPADSSDGDEE